MASWLFFTLLHTDLTLAFIFCTDGHLRFHGVHLESPAQSACFHVRWLATVILSAPLAMHESTFHVLKIRKQKFLRGPDPILHTSYTGTNVNALLHKVTTQNVNHVIKMPVVNPGSRSCLFLFFFSSNYEVMCYPFKSWLICIRSDQQSWFHWSTWSVLVGCVKGTISGI